MQETGRSGGTAVLIPEIVMRTVATNLHRARVTALPKMSQQDLADRAGVSLNTVAKLEKLRDPDVPIREGVQFGTVLSLAEALRLSSEELLTTRVSRDGKASHLSLVPARAGPRLLADAPIQPPLIRGVSPSKDQSPKRRRSDD